MKPEQRVIKFRGLNLNGDWYYGNLAIIPEQVEHIKAGSYISNKYGMPFAFAVRPETVGQFTELFSTDKKEIWQGDIVEFVGGTTPLLQCGNYADNVHLIGTILIVSKLLSGYTLQLPKHIGYDAPSLVGNVTNYDFWNHARSLKVIGNVFEHQHLITPSEVNQRLQHQ